MPGKFEGEPEYVEKYWGFTMDSAEDDLVYDENDVAISIFYIDEDDIELSPELTGNYAIALWEDNNGFVHHRVFETVSAFIKGFGGEMF